MIHQLVVDPPTEWVRPQINGQGVREGIGTLF